MDKRLLLIGIDAADRQFIEAHSANLPNLNRFLATGVGGDLQAEPMAGAIWTSFCTRSKPADHGVFHHLQWDPGQMRVRRSSQDWLPCRPFWREMGERGAPVIALDAPFVFPGPTPSNVIEILNWGSHDLVGPYWCSDPELGRRVRAKFGLHPMGVEIPVPKSPAQLDDVVADMVAGAALRARLVTWLMRERPWQLFLVAFGETHRAGHTIWPQGDEGPEEEIDRLLSVYTAVDSAVGEIVKEAGADTDVILFALHGMTANSSAVSPGHQL